ncbi:MAG: Glycosyl transferase 11 family protein [Candidatus Woesebacteria bacterium GW2011_GWC1_42_9]|nr:MAG: Glycosyl transferase 11 family protein [Candidatus Woesebacteria bacterium GW2011_GWC1_42_9]
MSSVTYSTLGKNGRFGNQLFQIAATIAYAFDKKKDFFFPEWEYSKFMMRPLPVGNSTSESQIYREPHFHYAPIPDFPGNIDLDGYFQSEKYFKRHRNSILPFFTLRCEFYEYIREKYGNVLRQKTCAIHVRKEYDLSPVEKEYHGVLSNEYYEAGANALFAGNDKNVTYLICSDDIPYCKSIFSFKNMVFIEGEKNHIDHSLMSLCDDMIIANSSFSWWAAWMGVANGKRVVAPKKWFNNAPLNPKDIYAEKWIVI